MSGVRVTAQRVNGEPAAQLTFNSAETWNITEGGYLDLLAPVAGGVKKLVATIAPGAWSVVEKVQVPRT